MFHLLTGIICNPEIRILRNPLIYKIIYHCRKKREDQQEEERTTALHLSEGLLRSYF